MISYVGYLVHYEILGMKLTSFGLMKVVSLHVVQFLLNLYATATVSLKQPVVAIVLIMV